MLNRIVRLTLSLALSCSLIGLAPSLSKGAWPDRESPVRLDRLRRLADHLERVPPKKFDVKTWGTSDNPDDPSYVGCLAGHGTSIFKDEGFRYDTPYESAPSRHRAKLITFEGKWSLDATRRFFVISEEENAFLFTGLGHAVTPKQAAANVRRVISHYEPTRIAARP